MRKEEKEMGEGLVDSLAIFDGNNDENGKENQQFFIFYLLQSGATVAGKGQLSDIYRDEL